MPLVSISSRGFPAGLTPNGEHNSAVAWSDLVWAAITVGKRELFDLIRHGQFSLFEIAYRAAVLYANLREDAGSRLVRSAVYDGLDPSEKAATSYFIGMMTAKLLAELYLDVPWLMHLDVYRDRVQAELRGRSRPDLVGTNRCGEWIVIESKGRTGSYDIGAINQAKEQAQQIDRIGGTIPTLRIGLLAHFSGGRLAVDWQDPERSGDKEKVVVDLSEPELKAGYYQPFERLIQERDDLVEQRRIGEYTFRMVPVAAGDLRVGVAAPEFRDQQMSGAVTPRHREDALTVGRDGIAVELGGSWAAANMALEPQERRRQPPGWENGR